MQVLSSTFTPDSSIVRKNCFISNNTRLSCIRDMKDKISIVDIAKRHAISHATVNQSLRQLNASFIIKKNYLPEHLSMDEFKSVKSSNAAMSFIFLNSESGEVLDIVEDRRLNNLIYYFMSYSRKARMSVKTVCIDMYMSYMQLIKTCFPNAQIITDRFHIIQLISRALNKSSIQLMNQDKKNYNKLKRYWKLLLKNYDHLDDSQFKKFICFSSLMRENDIVNYLVDLDPSFKESYWYYQGLLSSFKKKDFNTFYTLLINCPKNISLYLKTSNFNTH